MEEKKPRLTNEKFRQLLYNNLNAGKDEAHRPTSFWRLLATQFAIDRQRVSRLHKRFYPKWAALAQGATEQEMKATTRAATASDLQDKQNQLLFLQEQINHMQSQLAGAVKFTFTIGGRIMHSHAPDGKFVCPVEIQNSIRRVIREFASEICKLQGHYAPTKVAATDSEGRDFDTSALSANDRAALVLMAGKIFR